MSDNYAFANLETDEGDRAAVVADGRTFRLDRAGMPPVGLRALMDDWSGLVAAAEAALPELRRAGDGSPAFVANPKYAAPIRFPNKLVCVGGTYKDHLEQMNLPAKRWDNVPLFMRPPSTSIVGPGPNVRIPRNTTQFDWEIELVVVIAERLYEADEAQAKAAIAGYSIGIDFGSRNLIDRHGPAGPDLVRSKAQDTWAPMGPFVAPARFTEDVQKLGLRLWVNGDKRQDSNSDQMLYSIYELVSTISNYITLEPGDCIFTGSPAGSARSEAEYLKPGDQVRAEIDGLGVLEVMIAGPAAPLAPARALETA